MIDIRVIEELNKTVVITLDINYPQLTQLIIIPKFTTIHPHCHPNVDKIITPIYGSAYCIRDNKGRVINAPDKAHAVKHNQMHSVKTDNSEFIFISDQIWLNGLTPSSIENDWKDA